MNPFVSFVTFCSNLNPNPPALAHVWIEKPLR